MQKWRNDSFVDVVNLIFGAWLFAAPWLYGFASGAAGWNAWIMGALIALVAIAALAAFAEWEEWINLVLGLWVLVAPWALAFTENAGATGNRRGGGAGRNRTVAGASQTAARPRLSGRRCKARGPADTDPLNALRACRA
jgi:SPW repeat-containing protein